MTDTQRWEEDWDREVEKFRLQCFLDDSRRPQKVAAALQAAGEDLLADLAVAYAEGQPDEVFHIIHRAIYNALAMSPEEADLALREHLREEALELQESGF